MLKLKPDNGVWKADLNIIFTFKFTPITLFNHYMKSDLLLREPLRQKWLSSKLLPVKLIEIRKCEGAMNQYFCMKHYPWPNTVGDETYHSMAFAPSTEPLARLIRLVII